MYSLYTSVWSTELLVEHGRRADARGVHGEGAHIHHPGAVVNLHVHGRPHVHVQHLVHAVHVELAVPQLLHLPWREQNAPAPVIQPLGQHADGSAPSRLAETRRRNRQPCRAFAIFNVFIALQVLKALRAWSMSVVLLGIPGESECELRVRFGANSE
eukprot:3359704-Pyramimonas_sp.AAC.1